MAIIRAQSNATYHCSGDFRPSVPHKSLVMLVAGFKQLGDGFIAATPANQAWLLQFGSQGRVRTSSVFFNHFNGMASA